MHIKIWTKTKNRLIYAVQYKDNLKALRVVFITYYGQHYKTDKFVNFYPKNVSGYDF